MNLELSQMEFEVIKLICSTYIIGMAFQLMMLVVQEKDFRPLLDMIPNPWKKREEAHNEDYVR